MHFSKKDKNKRKNSFVEGSTRTPFYLLRLFVVNNKHAFLFQQQIEQMTQIQRLESMNADVHRIKRI